MVTWKVVVPQLAVPDVARAQQFYREKLGFSADWLRGDEFGSVRSGRAELYLARSAAPGGGAWCCVRVDDADALYEIYRERGVELIAAPSDQAWGVREFTIRDPYGNFFRIGHSTRD